MTGEDRARGPQRSCVACRQTEDREHLVRLVLAPDGALIVDYRGRLPGRGAWLHPKKACVEQLQRRPGMLRRALGSEPAVGDLGETLRERVRAAILDGLSQASAAGALVGGREQLERAIREAQVTEVIVASDAAERTVRALRQAADPELPFIEVPWTRAAIGERIGRGARAAVGVKRSRAAHNLRRQLHRLRELG